MWNQNHMLFIHSSVRCNVYLTWYLENQKGQASRPSVLRQGEIYKPARELVLFGGPDRTSDLTETMRAKDAEWTRMLGLPFHQRIIRHYGESKDAAMNFIGTEMERLKRDKLGTWRMKRAKGAGGTKGIKGTEGRQGKYSSHASRTPLFTLKDSKERITLRIFLFLLPSRSAFLFSSERKRLTQLSSSLLGLYIFLYLSVGGDMTQQGRKYRENKGRSSGLASPVGTVWFGLASGL